MLVIFLCYSNSYYISCVLFVNVICFYFVSFQGVSGPVALLNDVFKILKILMLCKLF